MLIWSDDVDHIKSFGEIEFSEAGKYTYVIKEVKSDAKGIKYDTKAHKVTIEAMLASMLGLLIMIIRRIRREG